MTGAGSMGNNGMLRKTDRSDRTVKVRGRIVAFDRARTFITLLVLVHHLSLIHI